MPGIKEETAEEDDPGPAQIEDESIPSERLAETEQDVGGPGDMGQGSDFQSPPLRYDYLTQEPNQQPDPEFDRLVGRLGGDLQRSDDEQQQQSPNQRAGIAR